MASLHAITAIFAIPGRDLTPYMPEELSIDTWKKTYLSNFPLIDVSDLMKLPLSPIDRAGIVSARLSFFNSKECATPARQSSTGSCMPRSESCLS
jgi:hypothetical protein